MRSRLLIYVDNSIVGVGSWDQFSGFKRQINAYMYYNEHLLEARAIVDYVLEAVSRVAIGSKATKIILRTMGITARGTALQRGYRPIFPNTDTADMSTMVKLSYEAIILPEDWAKLQKWFQEQTGFELDPLMPTFKDAFSLGIKVKKENGAAEFRTVFDLETFLAPSLILFPGRDGIILPIMEEYAQELLPSSEGQLNLLPSKEALIRIERVDRPWVIGHSGEGIRPHAASAT